MKSFSVGFKLSPPKRFREDVGRLLLRGNEFYLDDVVFDLLLSEVKIYFEMFGLFMEHWIIAQFDATLIVAVEVCRLFSENFKFT